MDSQQHEVPLKAALQIEQICSEFESAWKTNKSPRLDDSLQQIEATFQPALLTELLLLEFHYQQNGPDQITVQDYYDRFPEHQQLVTQVWEQSFGSLESMQSDGSAASPTQSIQAKYVKTTLHREGGIGRVWIAQDRNLNRQVALKDLHPKHTEDPDVRERFIREAQITGKLEHPNIVPVYQLRHGTELAEPFYTMRLIEGKTLREVIAACHGKVCGESLQRRNQVNLLTTLMTVCQTIAYAHSQGVIHRDLKPENIVVGDYGEVFVLDWGLAKLLDAAAEPTPTGTVSGQTTSSEETNRLGKTLLGTRVGTPAYMAPEQAAGATDQIGVETDVYGLGAILFEILTAQPPHRAEESDALLKQIEQQPTPTARFTNPQVPPALDAICGKAMSKDRSQRYASALELKNEIESWIADEPVTCYRDSWSVRFGRWTRRHRNLMNATALLMLLTTVGLAIGYQLLNRAHQRTQQQKESAETDFQQARTVIEGLSSEINSQEARQLVGFKPLQRQLTQQLLDFYLYFLKQHRHEPAFRAEIADVHYQLGLLASSLESRDSARVHFEDALKLLLHLSKNEPAAVPYRRKLSKCYNSLGNLHQERGDLATAESHYLKASQILETLDTSQATDSTDQLLQLTILNNLATLSMTRGDSKQAIACFKRILASPQQDKPAALTITLAAHLNLGVLYKTSGKLQRAHDSLVQAKKILDHLGKQEVTPELLHEQQLNWYINQANLEISLGGWKAAQETSAAGIQAAETLVKSYPGEIKYQVSLAQLALNATAIWIQLGNLEAARSSTQKALLILHKLRERDPENLQVHLDLARGLHNLAQVERTLQHHETARRTIQLAIKEKQDIVSRSPEDKYQDLLLSSRILYANLLRDAKEDAAALQEFRELHTVARDLVGRNQENWAYQLTWATVTHSLAQMEKQTKNWEQAGEHYQEALQLQKKLSSHSPGQIKLIIDISITQYNFGNLHQVQSDLESAIALYQDAYNTLVRLSTDQRQPANVQQHLLNCHWAIAETNHALKRFAESLKHWDEAIKLAKDEKLLQFLKTERQKTVRLLPNQE